MKNNLIKKGPHTQENRDRRCLWMMASVSCVNPTYVPIMALCLSDGIIGEALFLLIANL